MVQHYRKGAALPAPAMIWVATTNVFSDAGVTPANNGDLVQQWNLGATAVSNVNVGRRPEYRTNELNGFPSVRFGNGATPRILIAATPLLTVADYLAIIVHRPLDVANGQSLISQHQGLANAGRTVIGNNNTTNRLFVGGGGQSISLRNSWSIGLATVGRYKCPPTTVQTAFNLSTYDGIVANALAPEATEFRIGGIASAAAPLNGYIGDIFEIQIFTPNTLTIKQEEFICASLMAKYGIAKV